MNYKIKNLLKGAPINNLFKAQCFNEGSPSGTESKIKLNTVIFRSALRLKYLLLILIMSACGTGNIKVPGMYIKAAHANTEKEAILDNVCGIIKQQGLTCRVRRQKAKFSGKYRHGILLIPMNGTVVAYNGIPGHFKLQPFFDESRSVGAQGAQQSFWDETFTKLKTKHQIIENDTYKQKADAYALAQKKAKLEKLKLAKLDAVKPHIDAGISWSKYMGFANATKASAKCEKKSMRLPSKDELLELYRSNATWKNLGCTSGESCTYWSSDETDIAMRYAVSMDVKNGGKSEARVAHDNNDVRCIEMTTAEQKEHKETQAEKLTHASKSILRYKFGRILKQKMLRKIRSDYIRQGFRGQRLATKMRGAGMGVTMGFNHYGITLDLKKNGYLIHSNRSESKVLEYRIRGSALYIKNKVGKFGKFGVFRNNKRLFYYLGGTRFGVNVAMEKY